MYQIDNTSFRSVNGFNRRVRFLVMHYTALNFRASVTALTGPSVSAHYLIPDPMDNTYREAGFREMRIFNLVDESERAWHAGVSAWSGRNNLNDTAIGIEIVNLASDNNGEFTFPAYSPDQVKAITELAKNILQRYPDITPTQVIGHSDIAPGRKSDPGASFPWQALHKEGIGAWYEAETKNKYLDQFLYALPVKDDIIQKLKLYGYDISNTWSKTGYTQLTRAFQLHFRPENYNGIMDAETAATLYALIEKYKS